MHKMKQAANNTPCKPA